MESISSEVLLLLIATAGLAGFIDAIAGGGGLLALPALLWAGVPPVQALATNKLQGSFGTLTASLNFLHKGHIDLASLWPAIILTALGSASGTLMVQHLSADFLDKIIPILLICFALYFIFSHQVGDQDVKKRIGTGLFAVSAGFGLGFYDGFFGPGTGSFFTAAFVMLMGYNLTNATGSTKVLNFTSNIASLLFFALGGHVLWTLGLAMGIAQMAGAWLGSHLAIRHGARIIKPLLITVSLAISVRLLLNN